MAYSQFHDGFWTDPEIRGLSAEDKMILVWFITNPYRHYSGLYFFEFDSISKQTGLSEKTVIKGIDTLSEQKFIKHNPKFSMVWVIKMARHEVVRGEKSGEYSLRQTKGIANQLETLHKCPLIKEFLSFYQDMNIPYQYPIRQEEEEAEAETETKEDPPTPQKSGGVPFQEIIEAWNTHAPELLPRASLTDTRKPKIKTAWKEHPSLEWFTALFADISLSSWHSHRDKWQGCSFDWILKKRNEMREKLDAIKKSNGGVHQARADAKDPFNVPGLLKLDPNCPLCHGDWRNSKEPCSCLHPVEDDDAKPEPKRTALPATC